MIALKTIVLPTDFSEYAAEAVPYACELADRFDAELHVLHVIHDVATQLPDFGMGLSIPAFRDNLGARKEQFEEAALKQLTGVLPDGWEKNRRVVLSTRFGTPFVEIVRYAQQHRADMIVIGTHGRSGLVHALMGSVAEKVVRKAPCPVFTVRPKQHRFISPTETKPTTEHIHNTKSVIRQTIKGMYGPCPVNDTRGALAWADGIDWEMVRNAVDRDHAGFPWPTGDDDAARLLIEECRRDMLHDAGGKS